MAMILHGRLSLDVQFNGDSFPFSELQELVHVHMVESLYQVVPALSLCVKDNGRWLSRGGYLSDGTLITIIVSSGAEDKMVKSTFSFRKGAHREDRSPGSMTYTIDGWLDVPHYMSYAARNPVTGTSSSVLTSLAGDAGLSFVGDGTNDKQTWYPGGRPLHTFAAAVAEHGWASDTSCMVLGVTLGKELIYKDVTAMGEPVATLGVLDTNTQGVLPVTAIATDTASAAGNWQSGYGNVHLDQSLFEIDAQHTLHTNIGTRIENGTLQINNDLRPAQSRLTSGALRVGNGHDSYARAAYQNRRASQLFSVGADVVVPTITKLKSLDTVLLRTDTVDAVEANALRAYAGLYRVVRRVVWITPGFLVEKLKLARRTLNAVAPDAVAAGTRPASSGTGATTSASSATATARLSTPVKPTKALGITVPGLDNTKSLLGLASFANNALVAVTSVLALSNSAGTTLTNKVNTTDFKTHFDATLAQITALEDAGVAALEAHKVLYPVDTLGERPPMVLDYKTQIQAVIDEATPGLTHEASIAQHAANAATSVLAANPWGATSSVGSGALKTITAQLGATRGTATAETTAATASVSGASAAATMSADANKAATTSAVTTLQNDINTWAAQLATAQTEAGAALDAAA